jgi:hypothetical protein
MPVYPGAPRQNELSDSLEGISLDNIQLQTFPPTTPGVPRTSHAADAERDTRGSGCGPSPA